MKKHTKKYNKKQNKKHRRKTFKIFFGGDGKPLQLLIEAAKRGDAEEIYKLYRKLKRSYITDPDNPRPEELLALFNKINNRDENGFNALRWAFKNVHPKALRTLVSIGAIDVPDNDGKTILMYCIINKYKTLLKYLVKKNATFVTDKHYKMALQYFPPSGYEGVYPETLDNIPSILARKICIQENGSLLFADKVEPKQHTKLEEVVELFEPQDVVYSSTRNEQDYQLNEYGQMVPIGPSGAFQEEGRTYVYPNPQDIAKAEELRSNAWQIWLTADPEIKFSV